MTQNHRWRIFPLDQSKGVEINVVKPPKMLKDKFILIVARKSKNKFR